MRFLKRVNERGTLTLPHEVRQVLGVEEGDIVELEVVRVLKPTGTSGAIEHFSQRREPGPEPTASLGVEP